MPTSEEQLLQIIANSKSIPQLPESLSIQDDDYVIVYSANLQKPVKIKKSNVLFDNNSFLRADTLSLFPNTGAENRLYLADDTNRLYKWTDLTSSYEWLYEEDLTLPIFVSSLPATGVLNTIYVNTTSFTLHYWDGANFQSLGGGSATIEDIIADGETTKGATQNAIFDALALKVDKDGTKVLSDVNFSAAKDAKLASLESSKFKGTYISLAALQSAYPTTEEGSYAYVDGGVGSSVQTYIWDFDDSAWTLQGGGTTTETAASIKTKYESNLDTNAFTDAEKTNVANNTTHSARTDNPHGVTQAQVGLSNVNNTSDANKPVSNATQTALNAKVNNSRVLTDVPAGALFTDTTYAPFTNTEDGLTQAPNVSDTTNYGGAITFPTEGFTVTEGDTISVTATESAVVTGAEIEVVTSDFTGGTPWKKIRDVIKREIKVIPDASYQVVNEDKNKILVFTINGGNVVLNIPENTFTNPDDKVVGFTLFNNVSFNESTGNYGVYASPGDIKRVEGSSKFELSFSFSNTCYLTGSLIKEYEIFESPNGTLYKVGVDDAGARTSIAV